MPDVILVINAGSATVKFATFSIPDGGGLDLLCRGLVEGLGRQLRMRLHSPSGALLREEAPSGPPSHDRAIAVVLDWTDREVGKRQLLAAGHRVVHGGSAYGAPMLLTEDVVRELERLAPLAPLHQPHNLAGISAVAALRPELPQVACFDTAFHRTQPPSTQRFALPRWLADSGVIRYGFHGLSYEFVASRLPSVLGERADGRVVVAHLGQGASMCAMRGRQSVATTMGFTALDGLPMATRCGSLDPGVVLHLMRQYGMDADRIQDLLYNESGLLGLSGISGDMRDLLASGDPRAVEAVDFYVDRASRELGSLAAALGGLDAVVFTGGVGENAPAIRARICERAAWLGVRLDAAANAEGAVGISAPDSDVRVCGIRTDEELMIARHTLRLCAAAGMRP